MGQDSKIAWCDRTFNPWISCAQKILPNGKMHAGCVNCYAKAQRGRFGVTWGPNGTRRKTSEGYWKKPLAWNRQAVCGNCHEGVTIDQARNSVICYQCHGIGVKRPRVFADSLCDVFEDWQGPIVDHHGDTIWWDGYYHNPPKLEAGAGHRLATMADLRNNLFGLIDQTPNLDWLLATKRPENAPQMTPAVAGRAQCATGIDCAHPDCDAWYRDNVWLLYSASDQESLEAGLPHLLACRDLVPVLGLSLEPLVGPIDLSAVMHTTYGDVEGHCTGPDGCVSDLDWVIVGGESGPKARPCAIEWVDDIRRQCAAAGVPCFIKQDSGLKSGTQGRIPDRLWAAKEFPRAI